MAHQDESEPIRSSRASITSMTSDNHHKRRQATTTSTSSGACLLSHESGVAALDGARLRQMGTLCSQNMDDLNTAAAAATKAEQDMTLWEGIKSHPYAVGWSAFLSTCIIMEGFDKALIYSLFALEPFKRAYGSPVGSDDSYEISAAWQAALVNGGMASELVGLWVNGVLAERLGYRKTILIALTLVAGFITVPFFAKSLPVLLAGQILLGVPFGVFQAIITTYAAEVCPVALRAYVTTYVNLCWVLGQFLAAAVFRGVSSRTDQWAYRLPLSLQWIWPLPIFVGVVLAPEPPWWLIRHKRVDDAKAALRRLMRSNGGDDDTEAKVAQTVAMMQHTDLLERTHSAGTSYGDCFRGTDLRRTEIVCASWMVQNLCGSTIISFSTYFYMNAGMSSDHSFSMSLGMYALGVVGTFFSWLLMAWCGRRSLYLAGEAVMCALLVCIGALGFLPENNIAAMWAIGTLLLLFTFVYDATVGPVCYSLVAELSSTRLRPKTVVLARMCYNVTGLLTNVLTPMMLNPEKWDWGAKVGLFWGATCAVCIVWTYFRLPEPKGRTFGELDVLFEQKVSARKFKGTVVDQFGDGNAGDPASKEVDRGQEQAGPALS